MKDFSYITLKYKVMKKYIGKTIELFPGDTQKKIAKVIDVFDDGIGDFLDVRFITHV